MFKKLFNLRFRTPVTWSFKPSMKMEINISQTRVTLEDKFPVPQEGDYFLLPVDNKLEIFKVAKQKIESSGKYILNLKIVDALVCANCKSVTEENFCFKCKVEL